MIEEPYCDFCKNRNNANICAGCVAYVSHQNDQSKYTMPTNFKKEKEKMIVTIIGSFSNTGKMKECKEYWERFGHKVNCPCDSERSSMPLITKQSTWIKKIEEADLIVAISKSFDLIGDGSSNHMLNFGESTSYEMAIALRFDKRIVFW